MKKTKKLLACLIAAATMFTMGSTAFAADAGTTYNDQSEVTIKKQYDLIGQGTSPAEDFKFTVAKTSVSDSAITKVEDMPDISVGDIHFDVDGATGNIAETITLPKYTSVGVYTYTITETPGKTAGVTYDATPVVLKVTVVDENGVLKRIVSLRKDGTKLGEDANAFTNTYSAGTLDISKTVEGNLGDKNKYFEFKVTLIGVDGKTYGDSYAVTGGSEGAENPTSIKIGKEETFRLKHGDTISIANLPYGVTYTVTETAVDGYTTAKTGDTGIVNAADQKAEFTNSMTGEVDMGVNLTTLPYILVFASVIVIAGAAFITRRRRFED